MPSAADASAYWKSWVPFCETVNLTVRPWTGPFGSVTVAVTPNGEPALGGPAWSPSTEASTPAGKTR